MKLPGWARWLAKWLLIAAGALALALVTRKHAGELIASVVDLVAPDRKRGWRRVPGDPHAVDVLPPEGKPVRVKLPEDLTADDVRAIGVGKGGWDVEIIHRVRDRRAAMRAAGG